MIIDREGRSLPAQFRPMLATAGELPADDSAWAYEMKWDGIRAIATISAGALMLTSRTGRDITASYPELQAMALAASPHELVLDGEIVAFGGGTWPSFEAIQQRMNVTAAAQVRRLAAEVPVSYLAFDVLFADESRADGPALPGPAGQAGGTGARGRALADSAGVHGGARR